MGKNRTKASGSSTGGFDVAARSGYAGNGLSLFTRVMAHGNSGAAAFANATPGRLAKGRQLPLHQLIKEYKGRIRWIEAELRTATKAEKREKLNLQLEIKRRRLVELETAAAEVGMS